MSATRTLWTGSLVIGPLTVPVKMITVADSPSKVSFNKAHRCTAGTLTRMQQKSWCPSCKKELARGEITRVYEHAPGQYLEVTDAELATCDAEPSSLLTITNVIEDRVSPIFFDSTALLVADGIDVPFYTFLRALGRATAIGELVLQKRIRRVCLTPYVDGCAVSILRNNGEVAALQAQLPPPGGRPTLHTANVQAVRDLMDGLAHPFHLQADTYNETVGVLLAKKIKTLSKAVLTTTLHSHKSQATKKTAARRR